MKNGRSRIKSIVTALDATLVQIVPRNDDRNYLLIFNSGDKVAYLAVEGSGGIGFIDLPPHNGKEWQGKVPINKFMAKCLDTDTTSIVVWEA